jgi:hypothetical protein
MCAQPISILGNVKNDIELSMLVFNVKPLQCVSQLTRWKYNHFINNHKGQERNFYN